MILLLCAFSSLVGQHKIAVFQDGHEMGLWQFGDTLELVEKVNEKLNSFWNEGYLYASLDSIESQGVYFHRGINRIRTISFDDSNNRTSRLTNSGNYAASLNQVVSEYINKGHPFARLYVDSMTFNAHVGHVQYLVKPGPKITYDTIKLLNPARIGRLYLSRALEIEPEKLFSEGDFRKIEARMDRLPFLELNSAPDISFERNKATVYLDVKERKESRLEGVIGFLPGQSPDAQLAVTGLVDLHLANLFQSGRMFTFMWNRFANSSQSIDLAYYHPLFLGSRISIDFAFNLLKQDTTFLTQEFQLKASTYITESGELFFGYQRTVGSLISPNEENIQDGLSGFSRDEYLIGIQNPTYSGDLPFHKDLKYTTELSIGSKNIQQDASIGSSAYDSLELQTLIVRWNGSMKYLIPMTGQLAFYQEIASRLLFNDEVLKNELYRIGGLRSLRGFNENFFFAQHAFWSRFELRQYFERTSHFSLFFDQAMLIQDGKRSYPFGFGFGLSLTTSNGLFNFAGALGKTKAVAINPDNLKIHLGYISKF